MKSVQLAQLIYDITVHFVNLYIDRASRTCDQMVQAARSGVPNIAEGSVDAATSAKLELNLCNVRKKLKSKRKTFCKKSWLEAGLAYI